MGPEPGAEWVTASELAEYAYCPRAWWYGQTLGASARSAEGHRAIEAGERYHHRALGAEARRDRAGLLYLLGFAIAVILVVGGAAWLWAR